MKCLYCNDPVININDHPKSPYRKLCYYHRKVKRGLIEPSEPLEVRKLDSEEMDKLRLRLCNRGAYLGLEMALMFDLSSIDTEDLMSAGRVAALEALQLYEKELMETISYTDKFIRGRIQMEIEKQLYQFGLPSKYRPFQNLLSRVKLIKQLIYKCEVDDLCLEDEIHNHLDKELGVDNVEKMCERLSEFRQWLSRDSYTSLSDVDEDKTDMGGYETPEKTLERKQLLVSLKTAIKKLNITDPIDLSIMNDRLLSINPKTQEQIAMDMGVDQATVSRKEQNIMKKLKEII